MFPCLRGGRRSRFVRAVSSASISTGRVRRGSITSSTYPRSAADVRIREPLLVVGDQLGSRRASASVAPSSSLRKTMLTAPSGPITATSAVGHAKLKSARMCFELMTS